MKRTLMAVALSVAVAQQAQAQAQGFALAGCGRIEGAAEGIAASVTTMGFGDRRLDPHEQVSVHACLPHSESLNGQKCGVVFETSAGDLVAAQWAGPVHLLIETASLGKSGLQLLLEISRSGLDLASRVSIVTLQRPEANAQAYVGERIPFDPAACRAAPPPIRTVPAPAD